MSDQVQEAETELYPPEIQKIIDAGLEQHRSLPEAQAKVDAILAKRRALVLRARARGVSGYQLAKIFNVSQTTIGNWCNSQD
jgi:DNA-binding NarL/FixJ family response regulator